MTRCLHCYTRVMMREDGTCPSCGGDQKTAPADARERTRMTIFATDPLPRLCAGCANKTAGSKNLRIRQEATTTANRVFTVLLALVAPILALLALLVGTKRVSKSVKIRLPICLDCAKSQRFDILHADFDRSSLDLIVHERFKRAVLKSR